MSGLYVGDMFLTEGHYRQGQVYNQPVLLSWHEKRVRIQCGCQTYGVRAEMHVRKTSKGNYTLANNPEQADKHTPSCSFYSTYERSSNGSTKLPPVQLDGDKLIVRIQLFHSGGKRSDGKVSKEEDRGKEAQPKSSSSFSFNDFIYHWYLQAVKQLVREKKKLTDSSVLFIMWKMMLDHRIWIDTQDFYYHGYIPNQSFKHPKGQKVILGWIRGNTKLDGGARWTLEGVGKSEMSIIVKENHNPTCQIDHKLAALRVDFTQNEPVTISPARVWRITKQGWWLFSDAEEKLLQILEQENIPLKRPLWPSAEWFGYQPDFVTIKDKKLVFIDVLDKPDEGIQNREYRKRQEEVFRAAAKEGIIRYIEWRCGDRFFI